MKKISILIPVAIFLFASQASALDLGVNANADVDVKVKGSPSTSSGQVATSSTKIGAKAEVKEHSSSTVSAEAREVRGWSEADKKAFLTSVKAQAQLKSGQELENFAKGVMLKDENVTAVTTDENNVEVHYKLPAKFLGLFSSSIETIANVSFESDKYGRGPKEVTVKFPWYRRFFSLASSTQESVIKAAIETSVQENAQTPRDNVYAQNGVTVNLVSSILKGIRAELSATTSASVK